MYIYIILKFKEKNQRTTCKNGNGIEMYLFWEDFIKNRFTKELNHGCFNQKIVYSLLRSEKLPNYILQKNKDSVNENEL